MQYFLYLLSAVVWWLIGYMIFYRRYENRELVNELRKHVKELTHDCAAMNSDIREFEQQNIVLKEELTQIYEKNDDLTDVVSELSRYYYHMRKASEKMTDLVRYLQIPDDALTMRIESYVGKDRDSLTEDDEDEEYHEKKKKRHHVSSSPSSGFF